LGTEEFLLFPSPELPHMEDVVESQSSLALPIWIFSLYISPFFPANHFITQPAKSYNVLKDFKFGKKKKGQ
jgi:hypothetical protein